MGCLPQLSDEPIETKELTESFGWNREHAWQQHDIQELMRLLSDYLEKKMKVLTDPATSGSAGNLVPLFFKLSLTVMAPHVENDAIIDFFLHSKYKRWGKIEYWKGGEGYCEALCSSTELTLPLGLDGCFTPTNVRDFPGVKRES